MRPYSHRTWKYSQMILCFWYISERSKGIMQSVPFPIRRLTCRYYTTLSLIWFILQRWIWNAFSFRAFMIFPVEIQSNASPHPPKMEILENRSTKTSLKWNKKLEKLSRDDTKPQIHNKGQHIDEHRSIHFPVLQEICLQAGRKHGYLVKCSNNS